MRAFVHKILVSEKDKETNTQKVQIVYNFVGIFDFGEATQQTGNTRNEVKAVSA